MDTALTVLIAVTAVLLLAALMAARLRRSPAPAPPEEASAEGSAESDDGPESLPEEEPEEEEDLPPPAPPPRDPRAVGPEDLSPGDTVYVTTSSGSTYAFVMCSPVLKLFRVRGRSSGGRRRIDMDVLFYGEFVPGKPIRFWMTDRIRWIMTTRVDRVLIEYAPDRAISD